jgi:hypothetical protein
MATIQYNVTHLILSLMIISLKSPAQIPNSGFEEWTTTGNRTSPVGWNSTNDFCDTMAGYFPITKSTDHYPQSNGSYSIRIANNLAAQGFAALGVAMTTPLDTADTMEDVRFPISGYPDTLYGYYKFLPQNNDTMNICIRVYKNSEGIAEGCLKSSTTISGWKLFKVPISKYPGSPYTDADNASMRISAYFSDSGHIVHGNSVLYVDNLSLSPPTTFITSPRLTNPASFNISIVSHKLTFVLQKETFVSVRIYDLKGKLLQVLLNEAQNAGAHSLPLSWNSLSEGSYVIDLNAGGVSLYNRFSIVR